MVDARRGGPRECRAPEGQVMVRKELVGDLRAAARLLVGDQHGKLQSDVLATTLNEAADEILAWREKR